jgi:hypothetical protein
MTNVDGKRPGSADHPSATELAAQLRAAAERRWGVDRAAELAGAIDVAAGTLAQVAATELELEDDEPDFVR